MSEISETKRKGASLRAIEKGPPAPSLRRQPSSNKLSFGGKSAARTLPPPCHDRKPHGLCLCSRQP
jgi:hypothetical protein